MGKHDVENDQIKRQAGRLVQPFLSVLCEIHDVAFTAEAITQRHSQAFFVFDQQNAFVHGCSSALTTIVFSQLHPYRSQTSHPRWHAGNHSPGYSSPASLCTVAPRATMDDAET